MATFKQGMSSLATAQTLPKTALPHTPLSDPPTQPSEHDSVDTARQRVSDHFARMLKTKGTSGNQGPQAHLAYQVFAGAFQKSLKTMLQDNPKLTRTENEALKIQRLQDYLFTASGTPLTAKLLDLPKGQLTEIFQSFRELGDTASMIKMMKESVNSGFNTGTINQQLYVDALLDTTPPDVATANKVVNKLLSVNPTNPRSLFLKAKVFEAARSLLEGAMKTIASGDVSSLEGLKELLPSLKQTDLRHLDEGKISMYQVTCTKNMLQAMEKAVHSGCDAGHMMELGLKFLELGIKGKVIWAKHLSLTETELKALSSKLEAIKARPHTSKEISVLKTQIVKTTKIKNQSLAALERVKNTTNARAEAVAKLIGLAYIRDGGSEAVNHEVVLAQLIGSIISDAPRGKVHALHEQLLGLETESWKIREAAGKMEQLDKLLTDLNDGKALRCGSEVTEIVAQLKARQAFYDTHVAAQSTLLQAVSLHQAVLTTEQLIKKKVHEKSFNYRGVWQHHIPGNFTFGGIIYPHSINQTDHQFFNKLLEVPIKTIIDYDKIPLAQRWRLPEEGTLTDISDPMQFAYVCRQFIRQTFRTDQLQLEDLHGDGHKFFEGGLAAMFEQTGVGAKRDVDARTSLCEVVRSRFGDCRQHAWTSQLMFDMWQSSRANNQIRTAMGALRSGDESYFQRCVEGVKDIYSTELRTFDVVIQAPIEMHQMYKPKLSKDGKPILATKPVPVEEHTMNLMGQGDDWHLCDSFYTEYYKFGDQTKIPKPIEFLTGPVDTGKTMLAVDGSGQEVEVRVCIQPTPYAGPRAVADFCNEGSRLCGSETVPPTMKEVTVEARDTQDKALGISSTPQTQTP